jgi:hypothetical protein
MLFKQCKVDQLRKTSLKEEENCNKFIFRMGVVLSSGAVIRLYGLVLSLALLALV